LDKGRTSADLYIADGIDKCRQRLTPRSSFPKESAIY
jgi:hypothetical protein